MKPPVVLLPALLCNAGLFIHQIKTLEEDFDFIVPDLGLEKEISSCAKRILTQLPSSFVLGGISMGGYVAFEILRQAPERVKGLILMDTNASEDTQEKKKKRLEMIELAKTNGIEPLIKPSLIDILAPCHQQNEMINHILVHMARATGVEKYINEQHLIMSRKSAFSLLDKMTCPTLVLTGDQDALSPIEEMEKLAKKIPYSLFAIIENAGHLPCLEKPSAINGVLKTFIKQIKIN